MAKFMDQRRQQVDVCAWNRRVFVTRMPTVPGGCTIQVNRLGLSIKVGQFRAWHVFDDQTWRGRNGDSGNGIPKRNRFGQTSICRC